jgi:hypothetical protein
VLAVLSQLSGPGCPISDVLSQLSCPSFPLLKLHCQQPCPLILLSYPGSPVISLQSCHLLAVLSSPGSPVILSFPSSPFPGFPVRTTCRDYPVLAALFRVVLSQIFYVNCPATVFPFRLSCLSNSVLAFTFLPFCLFFLFWLNYPVCLL